MKFGIMSVRSMHKSLLSIRYAISTEGIAK